MGSDNIKKGSRHALLCLLNMEYVRRKYIKEHSKIPMLNSVMQLRMLKSWVYFFHKTVKTSFSLSTARKIILWRLLEVKVDQPGRVLHSK